MIAADVFLEPHGQVFPKSPELHLPAQVKYPKFQPETSNVGDYGIPSSEHWQTQHKYRTCLNVILLLYLHLTLS